MFAAVVLGALALATSCGSARAGRPLAVGPAARLPAAHSSRVVEIVMENAEYDEVIGSGAAPYVNALARRYGLAEQSFAITHPSLPNYLALTSGSTHGITSDCTGCGVSAPNIVDQLEAAGISWRAYLEDAPAPCFQGAGAGGYAKKHNPFIYYRDVARSQARCRHLVGFGPLASDLRRGSLPTYVWITPNLCDDGHDCGVGAGDRFLARTVPLLLRELGPHGFLVITWDEGSSNAGCCGGAAGGRIATLVAGPEVRGGARSSTPVDHYGVLGTVEEALGLPALGGARNPRSGRLTALFAHPPHLR
ncbi:MAG: alkaline phosphatase family protein [Solirubrobacterales bacterium]|nr:alkaline phosphatase family protein [Solirubrobacterales bacterium]